MDESSKSKLAESPISPLPLKDAECAQCLGINEHHQHRPKGMESHWDLVTGEVPHTVCWHSRWVSKLLTRRRHPPSLLPMGNFCLLGIGSSKVCVLLASESPVTVPHRHYQPEWNCSGSLSLTENP